MCSLMCSIQNWCRQIATMLPWLVIPLILLWALSQLFPPAFRFEITLPSLACVFVLLFTLFWYEILMPQLSAWQVRRDARLRERRRVEAVELVKLRKFAIKRCRNCFTAYRDQNPNGGGGKFMCAYCGHVSKRPVLDLPVGNGMAGNGILEGFLSRGGKLLAAFLVSVKWICRKVFRVDESLCDNGRGMSSKRGGNEGNYESRGAKARRKAEEKKLARLEKEILEEEEKKQREEVARLVEERRKMRDEIEAEKGNEKMSSLPAKERCGGRKEGGKKRHEGRKDRERCSSKSNSDVEEVEKKSETGRHENKRPGYKGNVRSQGTETGHGFKSMVKSYSRGNTGARYFDSMKVSFLSSSKAFTGTSFFGKDTTKSPSTVKENKSSNSTDHVYNSAYRRVSNQTDHQAGGRLSMRADDKNATRPVFVETQSRPEPKKSWHQLFTGSSPVTPPSNAKVISRPTPKSPPRVQSPPLSGQPLGTQSYDNPISFGLPSPFPLPSYPSVSSDFSLGFSSPIEPIFSLAEESLHGRMPEEQEPFQDPVSLLGPVSESLDNFQLDLGTSLPPDTGLEKPSPKKSVSSAADINKQSPIESPWSRLRVADIKHSNSSLLPVSPKVHDMPNSLDANEKGTWQMWNSTTLGQGSLGLVGGLPSWLVSSDGSRSKKEDVVNPPAQRVKGPLLKKEDQVLFGNCSRQAGNFCNGQNVGTLSPIFSLNDHNPWVDKALFPPLSDSENYFLLKSQQYSVQNEMIKGSPDLLPASQPHELYYANCWSQTERFAGSAVKCFSCNYGCGLYVLHPCVVCPSEFH